MCVDNNNGKAIKGDFTLSVHACAGNEWFFLMVGPSGEKKNSVDIIFTVPLQYPHLKLKHNHQGKLVSHQMGHPVKVQYVSIRVLFK